MAKSITEWQNIVIAQVRSDQTLSGQLTSTSQVAIWRLWTYVIAVIAWTIDNLFDLFRTEINSTIDTLKPHSLRWYAGKAKAFQYGFNLSPESDSYNNTGIDPDAVTASRIVSYAAVVEQTKGLRIKVAKDTGQDLGALSPVELAAFVQYMKQVKDAGVQLLITSGPADSLKLKADIYYNPLVLNNQGNRVDGASMTPVQDAIKGYLKNLPFNGVFTLQNLVDVLQAVDGVNTIDIQDAQAQYGQLPFTPFRVMYIPDAGYLRIAQPVDLQLNFVPYSE